MNTIISLAYICSRGSLLEPRQNNLSNPEVYLEPYQTSNMGFLAKIVNGLKPLIFFVKHFIVDIWQNSEYASVICYSLFGKIEDVNKIDSVAIQIFSF